MAKNHVQPGIVIEVTLTAVATSGDLIKVGDLVGVALKSGGIGDAVSVQIAEVFKVPKLAADNMGQGVKVYYDAANKRVTLADASGANILAGRTAAAAAATTTAVDLKLNA